MPSREVLGPVLAQVGAMMVATSESPVVALAATASTWYCPSPAGCHSEAVQGHSRASIRSSLCL